MWFELYKLLPSCAGTDKYHCPEYVERQVDSIAAIMPDGELAGVIGKYRNEYKQDLTVSFSNQPLQRRFERLGAIANIKQQILNLPDNARIKVFAAVVHHETRSVHLHESGLERAYVKELARSHDKLLEAAKEVCGKSEAFETDEALIKAYADLEQAIAEAEKGDLV